MITRNKKSAYFVMMLTAFLAHFALKLDAANSDLNPPNKTTKFLLADTESEACKSREGLKINDCHDGDTCQVTTESGLWFNVRLAGIDAPEISSAKSKSHMASQPLADEARDKLLELIRSGKELKINQLDMDPYNRAVVEIHVGGESVNLKLLELGLAERYRGKSKLLDQSRYRKAEQSARLAKRGIWGLKQYQSPSQWRKLYKGNR